MLRCARRAFSPEASLIRHFHVTVLGAANEVGQTISLLLRAQPCVTKLVLYDHIPETHGVLLDVSHVPSESSIVGYSGEDTLDTALKGSNLVIVAGGVVLNRTWTKKACFNANANFIKKVAAKISKTTPMPFVGIVTEPINCTVPMAAEVMRNHGTYDERKMFGITGIDSLRSQCLYSLETKRSPCECFVPVIGGHSELTTVPLLSQATPKCTMALEQIQEFASKIRKGDDMVTRAKRGWAPTLSVAYSVLVFVRGILHALDGHTSKVHAYVENNDFGTSFFSGIVSVTKEGVCEMERYKNLTEYECHMLQQCTTELRRDIAKGRRILEVSSIDSSG